MVIQEQGLHKAPKPNGRVHGMPNVFVHSHIHHMMPFPDVEQPQRWDDQQRPEYLKRYGKCIIYKGQQVVEHINERNDHHSKKHQRQEDFFQRPFLVGSDLIGFGASFMGIADDERTFQ